MDRAKSTEPFRFRDGLFPDGEFVDPDPLEVVDLSSSVSTGVLFDVSSSSVSTGVLFDVASSSVSIGFLSNVALFGLLPALALPCGGSSTLLPTTLPPMLPRDPAPKSSELSRRRLSGRFEGVETLEVISFKSAGVLILAVFPVSWRFP
jgi:hypothetical protein